MADGYVRVEEQGSILLVRLCQPRLRNAYDGDGLKAVAHALADLDARDELRVGVLVGEGGDFCSGADLNAATAGGFDDPPYPLVADGLATKPVIAAIEGLCLGGGMMIATGADLRVGSRSALFGIPEARWGLPSPWLASLARQLRPSDVLHLALSAEEQFAAQHMREIGFLHRVVEEGRAEAVALEWAEQLAELSPAALRASKQLVNAATHLDAAAASALGLRLAEELMADFPAADDGGG